MFSVPLHAARSVTMPIEETLAQAFTRSLLCRKAGRRVICRLFRMRCPSTRRWRRFARETGRVL